MSNATEHSETISLLARSSRPAGIARVFESAAKTLERDRAPQQVVSLFRDAAADLRALSQSHDADLVLQLNASVSALMSHGVVSGRRGALGQPILLPQDQRTIRAALHKAFQVAEKGPGLAQRATSAIGRLFRRPATAPALEQ